MNRSKLVLIPALTVCLCSSGIAAADLSAHSADRSTRAVPTVDGKSLPEAYAELHRAWFRVTFTHAFSIDWSGECIPLCQQEPKRAPVLGAEKCSTRRLKTRPVEGSRAGVSWSEP